RGIGARWLPSRGRSDVTRRGRRAPGVQHEGPTREGREQRRTGDEFERQELRRSRGDTQSGVVVVERPDCDRRGREGERGQRPAPCSRRLEVREQETRGYGERRDCK